MIIFLILIIIILLAYVVVDKYVLKQSKKEEKVILNEELPHIASDSILKDTERSFYNTVRQAIGDKYIICPKLGFVNVLLCDPINARPVCGLVLNDSNNTMFERDQLIDKAYKDAGLPLIRFSTKTSYTAAEIKEAMHYTFSETPVITPKETIKEIAYDAPVEPVEEESKVDDIVLCPKCNIPMVLRKGGGWGKNTGKEYYACVNAECKETMAK